MAKKIENYSGRYKERADHGSTVYIQSESIRDLSALYDWRINPHLHTHLYQVFFIESGSVVLDMTAGNEQLFAPAIIVIPPGNVHGLTYDPGVTGHVLTIDDSYMDDVLKPAVNILLGFKELICLTQFDEEIPFRSVFDTALQLHQELFADQKERIFALRTFLSSLMLQLFRIAGKNDDAKSMAGLNENYFHAFQKSYKAAGPFKKSIPEFAEELNISTVHLNRICQAVSGKPASWHIQEHAVAEAKKLILYTTLSIAEIAYELNFSDPGYFSRLFRKFTGVTPGSLRKI